MRFLPSLYICVPHARCALGSQKRVVDHWSWNDSGRYVHANVWVLGIENLVSFAEAASMPNHVAIASVLRSGIKTALTCLSLVAKNVEHFSCMHCPFIFLL